MWCVREKERWCRERRLWNSPWLHWLHYLRYLNARMYVNKHSGGGRVRAWECG
jgi:hypothetical protein